MDNQNNLVVTEKGDPDGIPLVFIHGGAGGVWTWERVVDLLSNYRCILPELPEHGSSQANGPFKITTTAEQVAAYIRANLPSGRAHLVGLSVGGQVVLEMLWHAADTVLSAVVSGAVALPVPGYRLGLYSERTMALLYGIGVRPWKRNDAYIRLSMKWTAGMPDAVFANFKKNFQELTLSGWKHAMSEYYRYRLPDGMDKVDVPVLLVAGLHEKTDVQPTNRILQKLLPHHISVLVGDSCKTSAVQEHNWSVAMPELFARAIAAWIEHSAFPEGITEIDRSE